MKNQTDDSHPQDDVEQTREGLFSAELDKPLTNRGFLLGCIFLAQLKMKSAEDMEEAGGPGLIKALLWDSEEVLAQWNKHSRM